jgi:hypothetical protein
MCAPNFALDFAFIRTVSGGGWGRRMAGMTQMEAHAGPLLAGTRAAVVHVASEKTLYVA